MHNSNNGTVPTGPPTYDLKLYIAGPTPTATRAIINIRSVCEEHLRGRYELDVIDLSIDPHRAVDFNIISLPTLVKAGPGAVRNVIGDMSDIQKIIRRLDIHIDAFNIMSNGRSR